uniref:Uncharacterized protein n=1 Tax=Eutreptiella gymnastica TaxID=73025 RepID=A0A7S4FUY4_9EUGL|mmetsp:Transcript_6370/g.11938  ORF Transcript_6370/g.11938 Transcript_6370/m.11938 type:complete len:129 (-) Transcript_6370:266-652(-)
MDNIDRRQRETERDGERERERKREREERWHWNGDDPDLWEQVLQVTFGGIWPTNARGHNLLQAEGGPSLLRANVPCKTHGCWDRQIPGSCFEGYAHSATRPRCASLQHRQESPEPRALAHCGRSVGGA